MTQYKTVLGIICALSLAACAGNAGYQALDGTHGYNSESLGEQRHRVTYRGAGATSREDVEAYLLRRMAELTLEEGGSSFRVLEEDTVCTVTVQTSPGTTCTYTQSVTDRFPYFLTESSQSWYRRLSPSRRFEAEALIELSSAPSCGGMANCFEAKRVVIDIANQYNEN